MKSTTLRKFYEQSNHFLTDNQLKNVLQNMDENENGRIDFHEFMYLELFKKYDIDKNGYITLGQVIPTLFC